MGLNVLSPAAVKRFYDRFGARQDTQRFYEDRALGDLTANAAFADARTITEFGCGTGRFAKQILAACPQASYTGFEVSTTMLDLARQSLSGFGARASVRALEPGTVHLPLPDQSTDRLLSTYVLDLLPPVDIEVFFQEAHRVIAPRGLLCLVGLTAGDTALPRFVARLWNAVHHLRPQLVGGCRPIQLGEHCHPNEWDILHHRTVASWAVPSEVLVARPHAA